MSKYLNIVRLSFASLLEYRFNFVVQFLSGLVGNVILLLFWVNLANSGVDIRPYTITSLVYYYFFMATVSSIVDFSSDQICWEIREGHVANVIIKPISYLLDNWFASLAEKSIILGGGIIFLAALAFLGYRPAGFEAGSAVVFLGVLLMASVANFMIAFIVGTLGFWMMYTGGIRSLVSVASLLVSGRMVPMELLPSFLNNLSYFLPFRYIYFFPVQVLLGQIESGMVVRNCMVLAVWIVILLAVVNVIWRVGVRRLEVIGT